MVLGHPVREAEHRVHGRASPSASLPRCNFPVLFLSMYWKGLTTRGAVWGGLAGWSAAVAIVVCSKAVLGDRARQSDTPFPLRAARRLLDAVGVLRVLAGIETRPQRAGRQGESCVRGSVRARADRLRGSGRGLLTSQGQAQQRTAGGTAAKRLRARPSKASPHRRSENHPQFYAGHPPAFFLLVFLTPASHTPPTLGATSRLRAANRKGFALKPDQSLAGRGTVRRPQGGACCGSLKSTAWCA